jgi:hypothetical protein
MNTLAFFAAASVLVLIVLAKIPGLEHLVRPVIDLIFTGVKVVAENLASWVIWLLKALWGAHAELVQHLIFSAETLDPSIEMKKRVE